MSCILALLAIYTDARAYRPSASLLAFLAGRVWTRLRFNVTTLRFLSNHNGFPDEIRGTTIAAHDVLQNAVQDRPASIHDVPSRP